MKMPRPRLSALVLAAVVMVSLRAAADAPTNPPQYDSFTQDDPTIHDRFTKLEWERDVGKNQTHAAALVRCSAAFGGAAGRLPTVKELLTLIDEDPHVEYEFGTNVTKLIDQPAFDGTPVDQPYWTQTPADAGKVWTLNFSTGAMTAHDPTANGHTRCVR